MPEKYRNATRPVSSIDANSKGTLLPSTENNNTPIGTSPEAQNQSHVVLPSETPPGNQLLGALWRTPDLSHQLGTQNRQSKTFKNLPVDGVANAIERAQKLSGEGKEVYFACAEYLTPDSRAADNTSAAYAFWMDIDCGEDKAAAGKGYATVEEAEVALTKFCRDTGLPPPTHIVTSGGGLHVYWVVDDAIDRDTWQFHARQLKGLTKALGFLADPSRTADIASVLRIPGTPNHKFTPPRAVVLKYASDVPIECSVMLATITNAHNRLCNTVTAKPYSRPSIATATIVQNVDASHYGPPDLDRLMSALTSLNPDCDEETWKLRRIAPLADAARIHPDHAGDLYELARSWSSGELTGIASTAWKMPGGNGLTGEAVFDDIWQRFLEGKYTGVPVTLGTILYDAKQAGWAPEDQFQMIDVTAGEDA